MTPRARNHIVAGGGISGLLAALLLAESGRAGSIHLIEREDEIGGLLRSFDYGEYGRFDYGMHNMYETGVRELDELLFGLLPAGQWQLLEGNKRDLAGLYFNGRLQRNSLYMDLRHFPGDAYEKCVSGFFANFNHHDGFSAKNARSYAETRFGGPIAEFAVVPAIGKIFKRDPAEMDVMAAMLTSIDRVILFDESRMLELMKTDALSARLAYPEQRTLPVGRASGRKGYYPRDYGMHRVVDAFHQRLLAAGVRILTGAQIKQVGRDGARITEVDVSLRDGSERITEVGGLYWTAGLPALAPLLKISLEGLGFDRPLRTIAVNLLLDRDTRMDDLYYFYCYDAGLDTFRVTNFLGYCAHARRAGGTPICVELLTKDYDQADTRAYERQALAELERFGILAAGTRTLFAKAEPLAYGFPMPTLRNVATLHAIRERIDALGIENLVKLGILAEPRLFFQKDVVAHTFARVRASREQLS
jgi:protoporphyrinogen oxidase